MKSLIALMLVILLAGSIDIGIASYVGHRIAITMQILNDAIATIK